MTISDKRATANKLALSFSDWDTVRFTLSNNQRYELIRQISRNSFSKIGLEKYLRDLVLDSVDNTPEYIDILRSLIIDYHFENSERSSLCGFVSIVGVEKKEIAQAIVDSTYPNFTDITHAIVVGHLLGGLSIEKADSLVSRLIVEATGTNPLALLSLIIAIRIAFRDSRSLPDDLIECLHLCLKRENIDINNHILHFAIAHYSNNEEQCFGLLEPLVSGWGKIYGSTLFRQLAYYSKDDSERILVPKHFFQLIDYYKDRDNDVLKLIFKALKRYPECQYQIVALLFFWIKNGNFGSIQHWVLKEIAKKNSEIINEYIEQYRFWRNKTGKPYEPFFFEYLAKVDLERAVDATIAIGPKNDTDLVIMKGLFNRILGCCYDDRTNSLALQKIGRFIYEFCKERPFSYCTISEGHLTSPNLKESQYGGLIDSISASIERIDYLPASYDFEKIRSALSRYPVILDLFSATLMKCQENQKFHPLLKILELAYDEGQEVDRSRPAYYSAQLDQLEKGCLIHLTVPSGTRNTESSKKRHLKKIIKEFTIDQFWNFFSELLLINRFGPNMVSAVDQKITNDKDIDLDISFNNARLLIEIIAPEKNRETKVSNNAQVLISRVKGAVESKHDRFRDSGAFNLVQQRNDVYAIIGINIDKLALADIDSLEALVGPIGILISDDDNQDTNPPVLCRDHSSAILEKLEFGNLISAVICYKMDYSVSIDGESGIDLKGFIFDNPLANNRLTSMQLNNLSKCIFNKP